MAVHGLSAIEDRDGHGGKGGWHFLVKMSPFFANLSSTHLGLLQGTGNAVSAVAIATAGDR